MKLVLQLYHCQYLDKVNVFYPLAIVLVNNFNNLSGILGPMPLPIFLRCEKECPTN